MATNVIIPADFENKPHVFDISEDSAEYDIPLSRILKELNKENIKNRTPVIYCTVVATVDLSDDAMDEVENEKEQEHHIIAKLLTNDKIDEISEFGDVDVEGMEEIFPVNVIHSGSLSPCTTISTFGSAFGSYMDDEDDDEEDDGEQEPEDQQEEESEEDEEVEDEEEGTIHCDVVVSTTAATSQPRPDVQLTVLEILGDCSDEEEEQAEEERKKRRRERRRQRKMKECKDRKKKKSKKAASRKAKNTTNNNNNNNNNENN